MEFNEFSAKRSAIGFAALFTLFEFFLLERLFTFLAASAVV